MNRGMGEPPEGAIVGESVPVENDRDEIEESLIEECMGTMKGHPAYHGLSDDELREKAIEYLQKKEIIR